MPDDKPAPEGENTTAQAGVAEPEAKKRVELSEPTKAFVDELRGYIGDSKPEMESGLVTALGRLAKRWVEQELDKEGVLVERSVLEELDLAIAEIDKLLTDEVNAIIHHDDFRQLEGSWRGLEHLVCRTMTKPDLKIRVMNISKEEIGQVFKTWKGTSRLKSPLYYKIYEKMGGMPNGDPFACIIGDYEFDHTKKDIDILAGMSEVCAIAHAPLIAAAAPSLFGEKKWQDLPDAMDLEKLMDLEKYAEWNSLRDQPDSRYVGLTMPRFLARTPYSVKNNPIDGWAFNEDAEGHDESKYVWSNAAYAMGANITRAFTEYRWCANIRGYESGGMVDQLPFHMFPEIGGGGISRKCPTEVAITRSQEYRLADLGLMPLCFWQNTTDAVFVGAQSLKKPQAFEEQAAKESEQLNCSLPYIFCASRFAHYLTRMCYQWIGLGMEEQQIEKKLNDWLVGYKLSNPIGQPKEERGARPLQDFNVKVVPVEGRPGVYDAKFELRPHFQLERIRATLTLVSRVGGE